MNDYNHLSSSIVYSTRIGLAGDASLSMSHPFTIPIQGGLVVGGTVTTDSSKGFAWTLVLNLH